MLIGDCFVFKSRDDGSHLWVVISDPSMNPNCVLIVNLTSVKVAGYDGYEDLSCVFNGGEHEWIRHQSYVSYFDARQYTNKALDVLTSSARLTETYQTVSTELVERIHAGAAITERLAGEFEALLREQGFIP